jgi:hypothetical protein
MGTDIAGWVEIKSWLDEEKWKGILQIWPLIGRDDMFGCLFGIENRVGFKPIAPDRGLPADISDEARKNFEEEHAKYPQAPFGATWITWSEIKTINWDEEPEEPKYYLYTHYKGADEEIVGSSVGVCSSGEEAAQWLVLNAEALGTYGWKEGEMWEKDDRMYQVKKVTRKEAALDEGWEILFKLMKRVAASSPDEDSRLVVWFTH